MRTAVIASLIAFSSCASVIVRDGSERVRMVTTTPHSCKYLGEISAYWKDSKTGGLVWNDNSKDRFTHADLKNKGAAMGADTIEVMARSNSSAKAEAYDCGTSR